MFTSINNQLMKLYRWFYKKISNKFHRLFVDLTTYSIAAYFALKKFYGFSATNYLKYIFTEDSGDFLASSALWIVAYAIFMKGILLVCDKFPGDRVRSLHASGLNHCCLRINDEIKEHLKYVETNPESAHTTFPEKHNFSANITIVAKYLHEHIVNSLEGAKSRDVFLSLYTSDATPGQSLAKLNYVLHEPIKRDVITSKIIDVNDSNYQYYECVKCIHDSKSTQILSNCDGYHRSNSKRNKKVKHYIGMKIIANDIVVGFLNIELYNTVFFTTEDEIIDYVEDQLLPYKYLLEYQFLKREFFNYINTKLV